jgi:hypothetical protein
VLARQAAASLQKDGHEILRVEAHGNSMRVTVRKDGSAQRDAAAH